MKRTVTLISLFAVCACAMAANYYCSPSGTGNGMTYNTPCGFASGVNKLTSAGDTLFCLGGQYNFNNVINITLTAGAAGKNLVICNYPGEKPVLDWRTEAYGGRGLVIKSTTQYLTIKGLTLRYTGKNAILNNGSFCTFENLDVYGNGDTGIQMKGGGNNYIINCDSHDNCDYQLGGITAADFGGNADGFADKQFTGGPNTYIGCRAWNNSDDGWDFFQRVTSSSTPSVIQNCICYNNGPAYYDFTNHPRYETDKSWFDQFKTEITITDADGQQIKASLSKYPNIGNGNGFKMGGGYTANNVALYHCLAVGNKARGFDQNNNCGPMIVYNGSAYMNGTDYGFGTNCDGSLVIKNCISYKNTYNFRVATTQSHNSWSDNSLKPSASDFVSLDTSQILQARTADGSLPEITFMHLQTDSKFIDAGTDVGLSYEGKTPDLGCYEFGSTISYPATLTCVTNNMTQSVRQGSAIEPITFKWGGSATGATISDKPNWMNIQTNESTQTITLTGTPDNIDIYTITVQTIGGKSEASMTATVTVKDNSAIEIAYVTTPNSDADKLILDRLNAVLKFSINIVDAGNASNDYSQYELIIISPVPNSSSPAMAGLKGIDKPVLLLKPFMLKNTVWNWGNSLNTAHTDIKITNPNHAIFKDLFINNNVPSTMTLFEQVNTNGVTCITDWYGAAKPESIAEPLGGEGMAIAEIPVGSNMNGTTITKPFLMIGISEYSSASLTVEAQVLIENACYYLLKNIGTNIRNTKTDNINLIRHSDHIEIHGIDCNDTYLFDILGRRISTVKNNMISTAGLPSGIYILQIEDSTIKITL